jgi:predicted ATP-binding protein involved in virulence
MTFPNCQFFMTTHSPIVASDVEGKVFTMTDGRAEERFTYGKDSEQILALAFNVLNARNKQVQQMIDETYASIHAGEDNKADKQLLSLIEKIGADDPVVSRLKLEMIRQRMKR